MADTLEQERWDWECDDEAQADYQTWLDMVNSQPETTCRAHNEPLLEGGMCALCLQELVEEMRSDL